MHLNAGEDGMYNLTLQVYIDATWRDAMVLSFDSPEKGFESRCSFGYEQSYLADNYESIGTPFAKAVVPGFHWIGMDGAPMPRRSCMTLHLQERRKDF